MDKLTKLLQSVIQTQEKVKNADQKQMIDSLKSMGLLSTPSYNLSCGRSASYCVNTK